MATNKPDLIHAQRLRSRAIRVARGDDGYAGIIIRLLGHRCKFCGEKDRRKLHIDHILPFFLGGDNTIKNVQLLCRNCHHVKTRTCYQLVALFRRMSRDAIKDRSKGPDRS